MNPGTLDKRIQLFVPSASFQDQYGEVMETFVTSSLWARVKIDGGNETINGKINSVEENCTFYVRRNDAINEDCYITYQNHKYNVTAIDEVTKTITTFKGRRLQ